MQALRRSLAGLFNPQSPRKRVRDDGRHIPVQDYMIGPLERTLIRRVLNQSPYMGQAIIQSVHLGMRDPLNIEMPATLPSGFRQEEWYVEIDYTSDIHRLVVSFTGPRDLFFYCHAFVTLGDLPESARLGVLADGPAIARGEKRLSNYVDMTALGQDPRVISVHTDAMNRVVLILEKYEDLMPWPQFEAEIRRQA